MKQPLQSAFAFTSTMIMFDATGPMKESQASTSSSMESSQPCRQFEFPEILLATNNFDESLVIGNGGFGKVYKANILNGSCVVIAAIKRLDPESTQGAVEFWAEVEMLSKLRHCHLVSLFGYCNYEKEMILIYEYMPNGTLEDHLHKLGTPLSWLQRLKICIGAARGLDYLHTGTGIESGVIHRDVKSSNILLNESGAAKISDFGLSKIGPTNQPSTYVNTLVKGTFGYFDPNYFTTGRLTRKSDVYAFGVVLLEVLCRKRAVDRSLDEEQCGLVTWAQDSVKEGKLKNIIDSDIRGQISTKCLKEFIQMVDRCLLGNPKQRPTMAEVVVSLDSILTLQEKTNYNSLQTSGKTLYERMLDLLPFPSNEENSAHGDVKLSGDKRGKSPNAGDTIKADNKYSSNPSPNLKAFKFADLQRATKNFSQDFLLGDNGVMFLCWVDKFTSVPSTKGVGIAVAVKRCQGLQEYETVVGVLERLAHPNIISLLGYSNDKPNEYLLVYEYMEKRNLDHFLFEDAPLSWGRRLIILIGVARALAYIHSSSYQVIHRNVKPSNIFLDQDFNAKLGDFGFAKFGSEIHKLDATTRVMGTIGYVDPWYVKTGHLTMKSDVYSFGVVLLVTLTGDGAWGSPNYQLNLAELAGPFLTSRSKLDKIMDPRLQKDYQLKGAFKCAALALRCVATDSKDRPSSEEVLQRLERIYALTK